MFGVAWKKERRTKWGPFGTSLLNRERDRQEKTLLLLKKRLVRPKEKRKRERGALYGEGIV